IETRVDMGEGDAALAVDQQSIEGRADPAGHGRGPLRVGIDRIAERVVPAALEVRPIEVAFDSQHQRIYLPIDADLSAADEAGLVKSVVVPMKGSLHDEWAKPAPRFPPT